MNIPPYVWGSFFWQMIHYVALSYPEEPTIIDKENYKMFFESLQYVLPCESCKDNMVLHMKDLPPVLKNNEKLFYWTVDLHNMVREMTNKTTITYEEAKTLYSYNDYCSFDIVESCGSCSAQASFSMFKNHMDNYDLSV